MREIYKRKIAFVLGCLFSFLLAIPARATHIVGGELEMQYVANRGAFPYEISLNLYFDALNGSPGALDNTVMVSIFSKANNQSMATLVLPLVNSQLVDYTNPSCSISSLRTRLLRYSIGVNLPAQQFSDPAGYYLVWERCCRNNVINNIVEPGSAGSTFYLEFPAIVQNNRPFENSSPVFRPLKGDYICLNTPFTFDFGAADPDRDSLVYTLVTPYRGFSSAQTPIPVARGASSYPEVQWAAGINLGRVIPGPDPLKVNPQTGMLTVTAGQAGLFVFCVQVDEFRRGVRIGRVRREFQLRVIDCPRNEAPALLMRPQGDRSFYREGSLLVLNDKTGNCLDLFITDREANSRITLQTLAGSTAGLIVKPSEVLVRNPGDTVRTTVCLDSCTAPTDGRTFTVSLIARDEGCPQGLADTLRIRLQLASPLNRPPDGSTTLPGNATTVQVGQALAFDVLGTDPDRDRITLTAAGRGFTLAQAGMSFTSVSGNGDVKQTFRWTPQCAQVRESDYVVDFVVTDNRCSTPKRDTVTVRLKAQPLTSNRPDVRTTLTNSTVEVSVTLGETPQIRFDAIAEDPDPDELKLSAQGKGFDMKSVGMQFTNQAGRGPLVSPFSWQPGCEVLRGKTEATYAVDFLAEDNSCLPNRFDTTRVTFVVRDLVVTADVTIPNVFTPNGDGRNDFFSVDDLPADNCTDQFRRVQILNRWGKTVYTSTDRRFRWDGDGQPVGTYYYLIEYRVRTFKGTLSLLR